MNTKRFNYFVLAAAMCVGPLLSSAEAQQHRRGRSTISGRQGPTGQCRNRGQSGDVLSGGGFRAGSTQGGALSQSEKASLYAMADEEKLAHDVYVTLAGTSKRPIFRTIAAAESRHLNALLRLVRRYGLAAPAADNAVGQFANPQVRELYLELVARGSKSSLDAVQVGVLIEEMDIADLTVAISTTTHPDVRRVFENLQRGSRNHLRAFNREMLALGGTYQPMHLSQSEFDLIVNASNETGRLSGQKGRRRGGGQSGRRGGHGNGQGRGGRKTGGGGNGPRNR